MRCGLSPRSMPRCREHGEGKNPVSESATRMKSDRYSKIILECNHDMSEHLTVSP